MTINFTKMNGAGNDFVVLDNRDNRYDLSTAQIAHLCDRHRGVGADGLLAVEPAQGEDAHFRYRYYNADGGEAEMCGNGARCYGKFAANLLDIAPPVITFETIAGNIAAEFIGDNVRIAMSDPFDLVLDLPIEIENLDAPIHNLNTGVPHTVSFLDNLQEADIVSHGSAIRYHEHFSPAGTNANFAEILSEQHLAVRTYERGVEGETLACGTGITACALIHNLLTGAPSPIKIDVAGGDTLEIGFERSGEQTFQNVTLTGPADTTFQGTVEL